MNAPDRIPVDAWELQRQQEAAFEASLKAYILARGSKRNVQFGGLSNLCFTLSKVCLQAAEESGSQDYAVAAKAFSALEGPLDLPYEAREVCDEPSAAEAERMGVRP